MLLKLNYKSLKTLFYFIKFTNDNSLVLETVEYIAVYVSSKAFSLIATSG